MRKSPVRTRRVARKIIGGRRKKFVKASYPAPRKNVVGDALAVLVGFSITLLIIPTTVFLIATTVRVVLLVCFLAHRLWKSFDFRMLFKFWFSQFFYLLQQRVMSTRSGSLLADSCEEMRCYLDDQAENWKAQKYPLWRIRLCKAHFVMEAACGILHVLFIDLLDSKQIL